MTDKADAIARILSQVEGVFHQLLPLAHQELLDLDLTAPQLKVVLLLHVNRSSKMSSLAASLGVTMATATGIVDRLVERGIVTRENAKEDRRVVICRLSARGQELTDRLYISSRDRARQLLEGLEQRQLKLIDSALEGLSGVITSERNVK